MQCILLQPTVQKYASMYVCTRRLHENLQKNETKILIVLKKACCHFPQKYLPCLSCVWKKCVFKVKNVSLVSLHLFYYLSDILLLLWFHPYYMKYYSIKCWKYLRKNFPVVYFEEKRDCSENEYPIMFVALLILLYHYYNTYISKSSELFQYSFIYRLSESCFKWHTFEFFRALFWLKMSKVLGSFS